MGSTQLWDRDLGKDAAVVTAEQNGANLPVDSDRGRLGLNIVKIREELGSERESKARQYREDQQERQLWKANRCLKEDFRAFGPEWSAHV